MNFDIDLPALSSNMRGVLRVTCLLHLALGAAIPSSDERSFEKRSFDLATGVLAGLGSIKQDLMAGGAAINQQLYQTVHQPAQYKKCNPSNVQVRQEWYVDGRASNATLH